MTGTGTGPGTSPGPGHGHGHGPGPKTFSGKEVRGTAEHVWSSYQEVRRIRYVRQEVRKRTGHPGMSEGQ